MPADLVLSTAASVAATTGSAVLPRAITKAAPADAAQQPVLSAPRLAPENRVVLDPASDRVVLEYFNATGALINSAPSQRQLDAYRLAAALPPLSQSLSAH